MTPEQETAFLDAVHEYSHQMYRIAMGYLHSSQDAQDAVSEAVEATWRSRGRIRRTEAIPAYLIRCVINSAKMTLRKKKRLDPLENYRNTLAAGDSGDPIIHYLTGMKERDQLILILKYQENMRESEIASILHMPRGTVSSRINTLLKKIGQEITKEEADYESHH